MNSQLVMIFVCLLPGFSLHVRARGTVNSNLTCYECNTYRGGILNACVESSPKPQKHSCQACMKVHTRMEMHDYWSKPRVVVFESFTCVAKDFSLKSPGCYLSTGSRSLTKVCYCYSHLCNSARRDTSGAILLVDVFTLVTIIIYSYFALL